MTGTKLWCQVQVIIFRLEICTWLLELTISFDHIINSCLLFHYSGTNNARLAAMLRQLAVYHAKDPSNLFMVRLAQGLTHLGKGTLTLCPYHSDRTLLSPVAVAGLLAVAVSCLDVKNSKCIPVCDVFLIINLLKGE